MDNVNNWEIWWNLSKLYWTAGNENWRHPSNWHWIKKKFTELKHSLLYSQELTNCPYPEPLESCPNPPKLFLWSILVLSFHIHLTCSTWSLSWRLPTKHCMHLCTPPCMPHTLPISFFLIWSPQYISMYLCAHYECHVHNMQDHSSKISLPVQ